MKIYNMFSCEGFDQSFFGGCSMVWLAGVILFFVAAICRKYLGEEMDIPFNFYISLALGYLVYFIAVAFTGSFKWGLGLGLIGMAIGGFGAPYFMGEGSSE